MLPVSSLHGMSGGMDCKTAVQERKLQQGVGWISAHSGDNVQLRHLCCSPMLSRQTESELNRDNI